MIAVIDYGMGNIRSVSKALEKVGAKVKVTSKPIDIKRASKIVFPGVGSFANGMHELSRRNLILPIKESIKNKKPFLGLCLGLQLLFEKSQEAPRVKGLGILNGEVKKIPNLEKGTKLKVPHIGWNQIELTASGRESSLFKGIRGEPFVYFVHSYYAQPQDTSVITSLTDYGINFCSSLVKDNIFATQFHPEKSQKVGLQILKNFHRI